jgi:hypothetical protein
MSRTPSRQTKDRCFAGGTLQANDDNISNDEDVRDELE